MGKIGKEKGPLLVTVADILAEAMWKNYQIAVNLAKIPAFMCLSFAIVRKKMMHRAMPMANAQLISIRNRL